MTKRVLAATSAGIVPCEAQASLTVRWTPLIEAVSARLLIAAQVALTKWNSGKPVEDPQREQAVIARAVRDAPAYGLAGDYAAAFFADQIEASKVIQYSLLADWYRAGSAPEEPSPNLATEIRPELDALHVRLLQALSATHPLRLDACATALSHAAHAYSNSHSYDGLHVAALHRALARVCEPFLDGKQP
jgi:chorismate mutase